MNKSVQLLYGWYKNTPPVLPILAGDGHSTSHNVYTRGTFYPEVPLDITAIEAVTIQTFMI